jgi:eukaryotic-like serine/threonine-protein kinase
VRNLSKIEEIYHAAVARPLAEREEFLRKVCDGDDKLRREVESLLAFEDAGPDFIESPPDDLAAAFFCKSNDRDVVGRTLNNYSRTIRG